MPLVSIIIPNYNNGQYLAQCLESVKSQTVTDWECIIIDDGSTDNSRTIIEKFCKHDKRFCAIYQSRRGVSVARNAGIDVASGTWISFLDSDDMLLPAALDILLYTQSVTNADIIEGGTVLTHQDFAIQELPAVFDPHAAAIIRFENLFIDVQKHCNNIAWIWRRIYRANLIKNIPFPENIEINEDLLWFMDVIAQHPIMAKASPSVLYHRIWRQSVTRGAGNIGRTDQLITVIERIAENRALPKFFIESVIFNLTKCMVEYEMREINTSKTILAPALRKRIWGQKKFIKMLPRQLQRFAYVFLIKQYFLYMAYGDDKN
ncbi:MAG: glycosyltransferase [Muribaculaceae bacterium]|nr:glycosyltransferase [Muribaculaceae bacterium]